MEEQGAINKLIADSAGIQLDVGCGGNKQGPDWVGIDIRPLDGVDIVHDLEAFPWPLPDDCALRAMASHVVEHINPHGGVFLRFMDEVWRVLKPDGQFIVALPYWLSQGYAQDPTHCNPCNQTTWAYFDPEALDGALYGIYEPKPWKIEFLSWQVHGNMEVILRKRADG
jgi:SAM-dependent methyltransferase